VAQKNALLRLNKIWDLTVGPNVASTKGEMRKLMNKTSSKIKIVVPLFTQGLQKQYKARTGKNPSDHVMKKYKQLAVHILNDWRDFINQDKTGDYLITGNANSNTHLVFEVYMNDGTLGTYDKFRKKNKQIVGDLVGSREYAQLFRNRTRVGKAPAEGKRDRRAKRSIADVGHQYSVAESGRKGIAAGLATETLEQEGTNSSNEGPMDPNDVMEEHTRRKLKDLQGLVKMNSIEELKTSTTAGKITLINRIFLEMDTDTQNRGKSKKEQEAGQVVEAQIKKIIGRKYSAEEIANAKGSPSPIDHVASMIINTPTKKRAYKKRTAKNNTKYKKSFGSGTKTNKASKERKTRSKQEEVLVAGITPDVAKTIKSDTVKNSPRVEQGTQHTDFAIAAAGLLAVKNAINKRLPQEVKRNMGRPALRNRTGRFAESTRIESITPAARTLMVKYTYRLNPYETFENEGRKKWPSGYNPKPLISKSIRNLALSMFKIDALTTRRV
jgi:hypothetical protein